MKQLLLLFLLTIQLSAHSQVEFPLVSKISTTDRIFTGVIGDKYSITIYLKLHQYSNYHSGAYSVKG